jgi:hypothetical protein
VVRRGAKLVHAFAEEHAHLAGGLRRAIDLGVVDEVIAPQQTRSARSPGRSPRARNCGAATATSRSDPPSDHAQRAQPSRRRLRGGAGAGQPAARSPTGGAPPIRWPATSWRWRSASTASTRPPGLRGIPVTYWVRPETEAQVLPRFRQNLHTSQDRASFTAWLNRYSERDLSGLVNRWLDAPTTPSR